MTAEIEILEADLSNAQHCEAVAQLVNVLALEAPPHESLSAEVLNEMPRGLQAFPTSLTLLAQVEDEFAGVAVCYWGYSTFRAKPLINIHDVAVKPTHRRRGIARALMQEVENRARAKGCCKITLEVDQDNENAQRLYADLGFLGQTNAAMPSAAFFWHKPLL